MSKVERNGNQLFIPYQIWKARSEFNDASIVWHDTKREDDLASYLASTYGKKGHAILGLVKFAQRNE